MIGQPPGLSGDCGLTKTATHLMCVWHGFHMCKTYNQHNMKLVEPGIEGIQLGQHHGSKSDAGHAGALLSTGCWYCQHRKQSREDWARLDTGIEAPNKIVLSAIVATSSS